jgi:hypothetical protein
MSHPLKVMHLNSVPQFVTFKIMLPHFYKLLTSETYAVVGEIFCHNYNYKPNIYLS